MDDQHTANDPAQVAAFVALFDKTPTKALIGDAQAKIAMTTIGEHSFVVSVSDPTPTPNCYLCSPTTAYMHYAIAETDALDLSNTAKTVMRLMIKACGPLVRATGLDAQIQLNNWMMSTNPVPDLTDDLAEAIKDTCLSTHPTRAIVIRSLNDQWDRNAMIVLRRAGFRLIAARQVFLLPPIPKKQTRDAKRDAKLYAQSKCSVIYGADMSDPDFERCAALYRALYLDKHTTLNPHYTARFLADLHTSGVMQIVALRCPDDGIIGFSGLFESLGTLTQPFVGYDTARPQTDGVYRMLMHIGRAHAQTHGLRYNLSAGAANFKRNRGAMPAIEYTAVYVAHRPWRMRVATRILEFATRHIGAPLVKRFDV